MEMPVGNLSGLEKARELSLTRPWGNTSNIFMWWRGVGKLAKVNSFNPNWSTPLLTSALMSFVTLPSVLGGVGAAAGLLETGWGKTDLEIHWFGALGWLS